MEKSCDVSLVAFFGDEITMTPRNDVITDFFKVRFRHNQFEKLNLAKSRNFRSPKSRREASEQPENLKFVHF